MRTTARPRFENLERRDTPAVIPLGAEFLVNSAVTQNVQSSPAVAMDATGNYVVVFESLHNGVDFDIYALRYTAAGAPIGVPTRVNVFATEDQRSPVVAMDADGDFVVVWESFGQDGAGYGVYARRFDRTAGAFGAEFRVNTYTTGFQIRPAIAMDADGDFVVAWESYGQEGAGAGSGVFFQRFNAAGVAQGAETRANVTTTQFQSNPAVAMDDAGDFVVAWESYNQDGSGHGIYARVFNAAGTAVTGEFRVNQFTTNQQQEPAVALDADGDFVIAWESYGQDGSRFGVYARRFTANGTAVGSEFRVNTTTSDEQRTPAVSMNAAGDFVVLWSSLEDAGTYGIYGQRYLASGAPDGTQFRANTFTTGRQWLPAVADDAAGNFVTIWQSEGQDGSQSGIYGQRFGVAAPIPPKVSLLTINGGAEQRSRVTEVAVSFDRTVSLPATPAAAFTMIGPNGSVTLTATVLATSPSTIVRLTFSGPNTTAGSLNDGLYTFTVLASQVTASGINLDGNGDGTPGDNYSAQLHRLFGDLDGNRTVSPAEFLQFRLVFLLTSGSINFIAGFDSDGDGTIGANDFLQFRLRFLSSI